MKTKNKSTHSIAFILAVITILTAALLVGCNEQNNNKEDKQQNQQLVGGDKDEHGCIGSAGYAWCESKQKCLRNWEEPCPAELEPTPTPVPEGEQRAQSIVVDKVATLEHYQSSKGREITVVNAVSASCPGCWRIDLEYIYEPDDQPQGVEIASVRIMLENWEVASVLEGDKK